MTLASQYKQYVAPLLAAMFDEIVGAYSLPPVSLRHSEGIVPADRHASNLEEIIQKEAVYCAIGRCAIRLKEVIPFETWVAQRLKTEAFETHQG